MRKKTSCLGCRALAFNRSLHSMDCSLGYPIFSHYPQAPREVCPKPRTNVEWVKHYVAACKGVRVHA